ncbi:hypothetical protein QYH69_23385 [Paraburkholderia sp. SARCC-3016]|uniref:hypothetical protein n=1 Tax=Paraburkholderia sp. SARCC-3016 TaxID=3058611 RepID=UPI0028090B3E|nr:hypothetical protein [Paraburkholderia sp. SARCC-3016]MDQ7980191.1 hypothetical protein [Paraburkholderia sp. SARCC-3016]
MRTDETQHDNASSTYQADARKAGQHELAVAPPSQVADRSNATSTAPPHAVQSVGPKNAAKPNPLGQYSAYAKYASTIVRQILFSDSRFNNSKLVMDSMLKPLQTKNGFVPPNMRLGTLGLTRLNSATANFSKAFGYITSALDKRKAGNDANDDIVSATALIGEGLTETFAGLGADVGNYLVKQWQTQLGATSSTIGSLAAPPSPAQSESLSEAGTGTPIPASSIESETDAALAHLPPMSPEQHDALMAQSANAYKDKLDSQLASMHERELQGIVAQLEETPQANQPARLAELSSEAQRRIETATQLATAAKQDVSARKAQSLGDFIELESQMKDVRDQLKFGKYTDPSVAGLTHEEAAKSLGAKLLGYRRLEEETAQRFEMLTEDASPNLEEMVRQIDTAKSIGSLEGLSEGERWAKLDKLKTAYRERFMAYQSAISKPTADLPEWLKISPALKAQLGPAVLNTAFAAADFGARIDDYIKKVAAGSASEADRWKLAGSTVGLVGGMASFIPVVGPIVSIALALAGIGISNTADGLADAAAREKANALRDEAVRAYRKKHPGTENYVYESDVGAGA